MAKTNTIQTTKFTRQRERFLSRLDQLLTEARAIEDALGISTRILPEPQAVEVVGAPVDGSVFEGPRGQISRKVWEYIIENPGQTSVQLCKALRMDKVPMATALNSMLRKNGQVTVRGKRGAYRYYAVTAKK